MKITVEKYGNTDPGRVRTNNEDTFICTNVWDDRHILCAAIDGVGGYEGGEVAAEIARQTISEYVENAQGTCFIEIIKQAVAEANNGIIRRKDDDAKLSMMGCVVSAAIIDLDNRCINIAHVGDSRIYCFHNGELKKISHDHSLVGCLEERGDLTEAEAMSHPQRNLIDRLLGDKLHTVNDKNFIDASIVAIPDGYTQILFCSDGLSDMLTSAHIADVLASGMTPEAEVKQLIADANAAGGKDNITVVIAKIHVQADPLETHTDATTTTITESETGNSPSVEDDKTIEPPIVESDGSIPDPTVEPEARQRSRRWIWMILVILLLGIALGVGGKYLISRMTDPSSSTSAPATHVRTDTVYVVPVENTLDDRKKVDSLNAEMQRLKSQLMDNDSIQRQLKIVEEELAKYTDE